MPHKNKGINMFTTWFTQHIGGPTVLVFMGAIISAIGALWATVEQNKTEQHLNIKNQEIIDLNKQITHLITGGDSYCFLGYPTGDFDKDQFLLLLWHMGKYPLYDVVIRIVDCDKWDKLQKEGFAADQAMYQSQTMINISNIPAGGTQAIKAMSITGQSSLRHNIFITSRNGEINQFMRACKIDGVWQSATIVHRGENILYKNISPKYPRNSKGDIDW